MHKDNEVLTSPTGVAKYPRLETPDTKFSPEGDYKVTLVLNKKDKGVKEFLDQIEAAHEAAFETGRAQAKKGKKVTQADSPIKPHLDDDGNEVPGFVEVNFKMRASGTRKDGSEWSRKPAIFDANKQPLTDTKIGGGSKLKVAAELNPYYMPGTGQAGVSLRLIAVQVIDYVKYSGGGAGFFDTEEGYVAGRDSDTDEEETKDETDEGSDEDETHVEPEDPEGEESDEDNDEEEEEEEAPKPTRKPVGKPAKPVAKPTGKPSGKQTVRRGNF